jgi:hypothetical protein
MKSSKVNAMGMAAIFVKTHTMNASSRLYPAAMASGIAPRSSMKGTSETKKTNHSIKSLTSGGSGAGVNQYFCHSLIWLTSKI